MTRSDAYDAVETLLVDTFAAHEHLADPDTARTLALDVAPPHRSRRRGLAGAAAAAAVAVVLVAGGVAVVHRHRSPDPAVHRPDTATAARMYAAHLRAAAAESDRVIGQVPLPAGATRLTSKPTGWPGYGVADEGPSDRTLSRTAWWSVPADAGSVESQLVSRARPGEVEVEGPSGRRIRTYDTTYVVTSPHPTAYTDVRVEVQWVEVGGRTKVRADTYLAAYRVRTRDSYLTGRVLSVDVQRRDWLADRSRPTVHLGGAGDRTLMAGLAAAYEGLRVGTGTGYGESCPIGTSGPPTLTLVFHTTGGTVVARLPHGCRSAVEVTRDGESVPPTLEAGGLVEQVSRLLAGR